MMRTWKWNVFRVVAVGLVLSIFGAISCSQPDAGGGDETAKKYKGKGPCG